MNSPLNFNDWCSIVLGFHNLTWLWSNKSFRLYTCVVVSTPRVPGGGGHERTFRSLDFRVHTRRSALREKGVKLLATSFG